MGDDNEDAEDSTVVTEGFVALLYTDVIIATVLVLLFCYVRIKHNKRIEVKRCLKSDIARIEKESRQTFEHEGTVIEWHKVNLSYPNISPNSWFAWVMEVWNISDIEFFCHCGLDAWVLRLFVWTCLKMTLCSVPFALIIMVPVYGTAEVCILHGICIL